MTREIPLTQGMFAIVDAEDYDRLNAWKWYAVQARGKWYAARGETYATNRTRRIYMHRAIMEVEDGRKVGHRDGNSLNNGRSNLLAGTNAQVHWIGGKTRVNNTSGVKGVSYDKTNRKWMARFNMNRKNVNIGRFRNIADAEQAYQTAVKEMRREWAS